MAKKKKRDILALGDQPKLIRFLATFLKRTCGDRVKTSESGREALKRCKKKTPDLVICMWWRLRDMTAVEFCEQLRATPGCEEVPVIISDMRSTPQRREQLRAVGANGYLPAPARPADVLNARETVLSGKLYNLS